MAPLRGGTFLTKLQNLQHLQTNTKYELWKLYKIQNKNVTFVFLISKILHNFESILDLLVYFVQ